MYFKPTFNPRVFLLGSLISTAALSIALPVHSESLKEIYHQALQGDHEYLAAKAELKAGLENKKLGRAALLPQVSADASYGTTDTKDKLTEVDYDGKSLSYGIELQQSIINFASWHNYKRGKLGATGAELKFQLSEQALILRVAEAYLNTLKRADEVSTAKAELNALSHQLEQTKQRFEVGLTAITEVHEAQAAFDSSTASRLLAEGGLGIAFESLEALTGNSYETLFPLKKDFTASPPEPAARQAWVDLALERNTTLQIAKLNTEIAEASAKVAKSNHLPTLSGSIRYGAQDIDTNDVTVDESDVLSAGLRLSVPIYSGGGTSAARRQAAQESLQTYELYLKEKRDAVLAARSTHLTVLTSAATVKAREQAITSNRSALEATQAGYDVGTRDLVDVLNSQRFLYNAERDYYDALYEYILATLRLKQAAGILTVEDLYQLDASLDKQRTVSYQQ